MIVDVVHLVYECNDLEKKSMQVVLVCAPHSAWKLKQPSK
jgi:hypothetical protein